MSSEARINASRANGAKSSGPVTGEGKQIASRNAVRHGLLSETLIVEGEAAERFEDLIGGLVAEFDPQTGAELSLIEIMAVARWRQMRALGMETAGLSEEIRAQQTSSPEIAAKDAPARAAIAFRAICDKTRMFDILGRYEARFEREYSRALRSFMELRRRNRAKTRKSEISKRT